MLAIVFVATAMVGNCQSVGESGRAVVAGKP